ncbi:MAG: CoA-binding protein [Chloroflexaceae bacterium]|nr:CoA-binding protein [Chloroflexaceae bacterium]NJO04815.1 CoA-binding protein [Chloroflexaceae bacterium]
MLDATPDSRTINPSDEEIHTILEQSRTIAVVGLSDDPSRPAYGVASYLQQQGYRIVPIHPDATIVLAEQAFPDLRSVPFPIDLVDIFRRAEFVGPHIEEAIDIGAGTIWLQLGIRNETATRQARAAGLKVVVDRCTKIEHMRLLGNR